MTFRAPVRVDGITVFAGEVVPLQLELLSADGLTEDLSERVFQLRVSDGLTPVLALNGAVTVEEEDAYVSFGLLGAHTEAMIPEDEASRDLTYQFVEVLADGFTALNDSPFRVRRRATPTDPVESGEGEGSITRVVITQGANRNRLTVRSTGSPGRSWVWDLYVNEVIAEPTFEAALEWFQTGVGDASENVLSILRSGAAADIDTFAELYTKLLGGAPESRDTLGKLSTLANSQRTFLQNRDDRRGKDITEAGAVYGQVSGAQRTTNTSVFQAALNANRAVILTDDLLQIDGNLNLPVTGAASIVGAPGRRPVIEAHFGGGFILTASGTVLKPHIENVNFRRARLPNDTPAGSGVGVNSNLEVDEDGEPVRTKGYSGGIVRFDSIGGVFRDIEAEELFGVEDEELDAGGGGAIFWLGRHDGGLFDNVNSPRGPKAHGSGGVRPDGAFVTIDGGELVTGDATLALTMGQEDDPATYTPGGEGSIRHLRVSGASHTSQRGRGHQIGIGMESRRNRVHDLAVTDTRIASASVVVGLTGDSARFNPLYIWAVDGDTAIAVTRRLGRHGAMQFRGPETFPGLDEEVTDPIILSNSATVGYNGKTLIPRDRSSASTGSKRLDLTITALDLGERRYRVSQTQEAVDNGAAPFTTTFADDLWLLSVGLPLALRYAGGRQGVPVVASAVTALTIDFQQIDNHRAPNKQSTIPVGAWLGTDGLGASIDAKAYFLFDTADLEGVTPPADYEDRVGADAVRLFPSYGEDIVYERVAADHSYALVADRDDPDGSPAFSLRGAHRNNKHHFAMVGQSCRTILEAGGGLTREDFHVRMSERSFHDVPVLKIRDVNDSRFGFDGPAPLTAPIFSLLREEFFADTSTEGGEEDDDDETDAIPSALRTTLYGEATDIEPGEDAAILRLAHGRDVYLDDFKATPAAGFDGTRVLFDLSAQDGETADNLTIRRFDFLPWLEHQTLEQCFYNPASVPVRLEDCPGAEAAPGGYFATSAEPVLDEVDARIATAATATLASAATAAAVGDATTLAAAASAAATADTALLATIRGGAGGTLDTLKEITDWITASGVTGVVSAAPYLTANGGTSQAAGFNSWFAAIATASQSNTRPVLAILPPGEYIVNTQPNSLTTPDVTWLGYGASIRITGASANIVPFEVTSTASRNRWFGFRFEATGALQANPMFRFTDGSDFDINDITSTDCSSFVWVQGGTSRISVNGWKNQDWRCDRAGACGIKVLGAANYNFRDIIASSGRVGHATAHGVYIDPTGGALTDTCHFDNVQIWSAGGVAVLVDILSNNTPGAIEHSPVNVWFNECVFDSATEAAYRLTVRLGDVRHMMISNQRHAADETGPAHMLQVIMEGAGDILDLQVNGGVYKAADGYCVLTERDGGTGEVRSMRFNGVTFVTNVASSPPDAFCSMGTGGYQYIGCSFVQHENAGGGSRRDYAIKCTTNEDWFVVTGNLCHGCDTGVMDRTTFSTAVTSKRVEANNAF